LGVLGMVLYNHHTQNALSVFLMITIRKIDNATFCTSVAFCNSIFFIPILGFFIFYQICYWNRRARMNTAILIIYPLYAHRFIIDNDFQSHLPYMIRFPASLLLISIPCPINRPQIRPESILHTFPCPYIRNHLKRLRTPGTGVYRCCLVLVGCVLCIVSLLVLFFDINFHFQSMNMKKPLVVCGKRFCYSQDIGKRFFVFSCYSVAGR
jgi:hypothetical protein